MSLLNAPIVLLREGTETSQGKEQIISNINVCQAIADIIRTTLGPRGMDKLIYREKNVTITNDGATILNLLDTAHPIARLLVELTKSQDDEVGDGTTSVVLIACELLQAAKSYIEDGVQPQMIIDGYNKALDACLEHLETISFPVDNNNRGEFRDMLIHVAETALNSKLLSRSKNQFAEMIVSFVEKIGVDVSTDIFTIKKIPGGSISDSFCVHGIAFKKTFSYAGFEQQPKKFKNPKILLLNIELELKAEKDNAEVRLTNPQDYQSIVQAEWNIIYKKLDNILSTGANIILSMLPIGDLATQYFADKHVFCAGRVETADMARMAMATGAKTQSTTNNLDASCLGTCDEFEEIQIGNQRWNLFRSCPKTSCATIVLRGCANRFIEEAERSIHDAIMVVCRTAQKPRIVCGAGSVEMKLSSYLRQYARNYAGKEHLMITSFARALEIIPINLTRNAGMDITVTLGTLRKRHFEQPEYWTGVDCINRTCIDAKEMFIWEPVAVRRNALQCSTALANLVLSIDETITAPNSQAIEEQKARSDPQRFGGGYGQH